MLGARAERESTLFDSGMPLWFTELSVHQLPRAPRVERQETRTHKLAAKH